MSNDFKALFVGDVVIRDTVGKTILAGDFLQLMKSHEICSCNFEAPIQSKGNPIGKAGPHLYQHPSTPALLESLGFNLINLANNHIYDYGQEGLESTMNAFARETILVGAGLTQDQAYLLKEKTVNGTRLGFLSFCEAEFGALIYSQNKRGGFAWTNHPIVNKLVKESRKLVDILIVQCHGGIEQVELPLPEWRHRYRELIDNGADAIIASHPHSPQGWEMYNGIPIFYSLGNFYFDLEDSHEYWNKGLAVSISIKNKRIDSFEVLGIERMDNGVQVISEGQFYTYLSYLNSILEEPLYSEAISKMAAELWSTRYKNYYESAMHSVSPEASLLQLSKYVVKRLFLKSSLQTNVPLLVHNIRIESHRWLVERALTERLGI